MKVTVDKLRSLTARALARQGYGPDESAAISEVLLYAQLRGNDQGVVKLIGKGMPRDRGAGEISIVKETPVSVRIDGSQNHAMVVVKKAVDIVIRKAGRSGFAIAGTFNTSTSSGAIGYFAHEIARAGLVGFVFSRAPERVAVHGAYEPVFGTNPLAISLPAVPEPVVLDMSTAAMSFYGVLEAKTAGRDLPENTAWDSSGRPTVDPAAAIAGALRSFDRSPKGSGLAFMVEALAGAMSGAAFSGRPDSRTNWGHLVFAIDPGLLGDREAFIASMSQLIHRVKNAAKLPGVAEIFVPGERGAAITNECLKAGAVEIEDKLLAELERAAA